MALKDHVYQQAGRVDWKGNNEVHLLNSAPLMGDNGKVWIKNRNSKNAIKYRVVVVGPSGTWRSNGTWITLNPGQKSTETSPGSLDSTHIIDMKEIEKQADSDGTTYIPIVDDIGAGWESWWKDNGAMAGLAVAVVVIIIILLIVFVMRRK